MTSPGSRVSLYAALTAQANPSPGAHEPALWGSASLYFFPRVVGILVLAMAGVLALYEGLEQLQPALLGAALGFEGASLALAALLPQPRVSALRSIRDCADAMPGVTRVERVLTMRLGRGRWLVALGVHFHPGLTPREALVTAERLKRAIRRAHPYVERVFVTAHGKR
ncbi:MAG TPA: hypothetical protein VEI82_02440 [Myxococcota bacterium]|nr:hypothetical protein [Myxococcota bacterium]